MRNAKPVSNLRVYVAIGGLLALFWSAVAVAALRAFGA